MFNMFNKLGSMFTRERSEDIESFRKCIQKYDPRKKHASHLKGQARIEQMMKKISAVMVTPLDKTEKRKIKNYLEALEYQENIVPGEIFLFFEYMIARFRNADGLLAQSIAIASVRYFAVIFHIAYPDKVALIAYVRSVLLDPSREAMEVYYSRNRDHLRDPLAALCLSRPPNFYTRQLEGENLVWIQTSHFRDLKKHEIELLKTMEVRYCVQSIKDEIQIRVIIPPKYLYFNEAEMALLEHIVWVRSSCLEDLKKREIKFLREVDMLIRRSDVQKITTKTLSHALFNSWQGAATFHKVPSSLLYGARALSEWCRPAHTLTKNDIDAMYSPKTNKAWYQEISTQLFRLSKIFDTSPSNFGAVKKFFRTFNQRREKIYLHYKRHMPVGSLQLNVAHDITKYQHAFNYRSSYRALAGLLILAFKAHDEQAAAVILDFIELFSNTFSKSMHDISLIRKMSDHRSDKEKFVCIPSRKILLYSVRELLLGHAHQAALDKRNTMMLNHYHAYALKLKDKTMRDELLSFVYFKAYESADYPVMYNMHVAEHLEPYHAALRLGYQTLPLTERQKRFVEKVIQKQLDFFNKLKKDPKFAPLKFGYAEVIPIYQLVSLLDKRFNSGKALENSNQLVPLINGKKQLTLHGIKQVIAPLKDELTQEEAFVKAILEPDRNDRLEEDFNSLFADLSIDFKQIDQMSGGNARHLKILNSDPRELLRLNGPK